MSHVRAVILAAGAEVFDGASYVGKIKLRDQMHFALESTELVVQMYSEVVIRSSRSEADRKAVVEQEAKRKAVKARRRAEKEEEEEEEEGGGGEPPSRERHARTM